MTSQQLKHSVAVVVRGPGEGTFLVVRRPDDPADPLAGAWGLPAVTLGPQEGELAGVARAGRAKLGVELRAVRRIVELAGVQGGVPLRLAEYEAVITGGAPSVPQADDSVTQYVAWRWTAEPGDLAEAASRGSLCARLLLRDRAASRGAAAKRQPGNRD